jgi:hypothetical protein
VVGLFVCIFTEVVRCKFYILGVLCCSAFQSFSQIDSLHIKKSLALKFIQDSCVNYINENFLELEPLDIDD